MESTGTIWASLDVNSTIEGLRIAEKIAPHPAIYGFKVNRLIDHQVFRKDDEPNLFEELAKYGLPIWADLKLHDIPKTVVERLMPYIQSEYVQFATVMAKGEIDMMSEAVKAMGDRGKIIAVTELTSLSEEQINLGSGHSSKASVINLARNSVLAKIEYLVCSSQELIVLGERRELKILQKFTPGITPNWKKGQHNPDQKRVGSPAFALSHGANKVIIGRAIVNDRDPFEAIEKTAEEIESI